MWTGSREKKRKKSKNESCCAKKEPDTQQTEIQETQQTETQSRQRSQRSSSDLQPQQQKLWHRRRSPRLSSQL